MAQRQTGLYAALSRPWIYDALQAIMGSVETRRHFVESFVRARPGDRILDIGCGTAEILDYLPAVDYVGFEPNRAYVEAARKKFGARGSFHVGYFDAAAAARLEPVDLAIVVAVLHHLEDVTARELFGLLRQIVKPGGRVVTLDNVYVDDQNPVARFAISMDRGRNVRTPQHYADLARGSFTRVGGAIYHKAFPPYTYWFMTAQ